MSQRVILVDDLDESEAQQTVSFGFDGKHYEIDLSDKNAAALRKAFEKYVAAARSVRTSPTTGKRLLQQPTGPDPRAVRAWAQANGIEVNRLGKVPQEVVEKYVAAGN